MVTITNGRNTLKVTSGAFENVYKPCGYSLVGVETKVSDNVEEDTQVDENPIEVNPFEELEAKPISQWTKAEVKEYAEAKGIDLSGTKNVNDGKERIKEYMADNM